MMRDCQATTRLSGPGCHTNDHFLTDTTKEEKIEGVSGAAVSGRLSLAGTEARPTELFSYKSPGGPQPGSPPAIE
jgi:hypothetical protein